MARLKVLVSAYACRPNAGSEPGMGWNTIVGLSEHYDLWVIAAEEDRKPVETYLRDHPLPNVTWIFFDFTRMFWNNRDNEIVRRVHAYLWQRQAYKQARALLDEVPFDAALHITLGSYWRPSFLSKLPIPYVWGPVGGAENAPIKWYRHLNAQTVLWEAPKVFMETVARKFDPFVRRTARNATVPIATTKRARQCIEEMGATNIKLMPQVRLPRKEFETLSALPRDRDPNDKTVRFFSSGRLIGWKGIQFAVRAFAEVVKEFPNAEYHHVGDGVLAEPIRKLAQELGVADRFTIFEGKSRKENLQMMANADVMMFPCLHDEPGWVVLEGMAIGLPTVYIKGLPMTPRAKETGFASDAKTVEGAIQDMAAAMLKLARDPELRQHMGMIAQQEIDQHLCFDKTVEELRQYVAEAAGKPVPAPKQDEKENVESRRDYVTM